MRWPIRALTIPQLKAIAFPNGAGTEAIPYVLFDTQAYPAAGVPAGQLQFFLTQQADPTLSNLETAGQLPEPQWLEVYGVYLDFLAASGSIETAGAAGTDGAGILNDIDLILKTVRATCELKIAQKSYGLQPATFFHASGGADGFVAGAFAAATQMQIGNNGYMGQTWCPNGSIVIPPKQAFRFTISFSAVQAISVATNLRVSLVGTLHRAVR